MEREQWNVDKNCLLKITICEICGGRYDKSARNDARVVKRKCSPEWPVISREFGDFAVVSRRYYAGMFTRSTMYHKGDFIDGVICVYSAMRERTYLFVTSANYCGHTLVVADRLSSCPACSGTAY